MDYCKNAHHYANLTGDIEESSPDFLGEHEDACLKILKNLQNEQFYQFFCQYSYFTTRRFPNHIPFQ